MFVSPTFTCSIPSDYIVNGRKLSTRDILRKMAVTHRALRDLFNFDLTFLCDGKQGDNQFTSRLPSEILNLIRNNVLVPGECPKPAWKYGLSGELMHQKYEHILGGLEYGRIHSSRRMKRIQRQ